MDQPTSEDQQQHPVDTVTPSDPASGQAVAEEQAQAVIETSADVPPPPPPQAVESLSEAAPVADAPPMETDAVVENGEKEKAVPESTETELKETVSSEATSTEQRAEVGSSGFTAPEVPTLSTRKYLDSTVVPILLQALNAVAKERPADPIEFMANFLLKNKEKYQSTPST